MRNRILQSTFAVTESTFGGTTGPSGGFGGSTVVLEDGILVQDILVAGVSSVAANTSGGVLFTYGRSSDDIVSTLVVLPSPTSNGMFMAWNNLGLECGWFDFRSNEAGEFSVIVLGK